MIYYLIKKVTVSNDELLSFYGTISNISNIDNVLFGKMPSNDYEVVLALYRDDYYLTEENERNRIMSQSFSMSLDDGDEIKIKIVGFVQSESEYGYSATEFYVTDNLLNKLTESINKGYNNVTYKLGDIRNTSYPGNITDEILPSDKVKSGNIIIPDTYQYQCKDYNCKNYKISVNVDNLYFNYDKEFNVVDSYDSKTIEKLTGYKYDKYNNKFYNTHSCFYNTINNIY